MHCTKISLLIVASAALLFETSGEGIEGNSSAAEEKPVPKQGSIQYVAVPRYPNVPLQPRNVARPRPFIPYVRPQPPVSYRFAYAPLPRYPTYTRYAPTPAPRRTTNSGTARLLTLGLILSLLSSRQTITTSTRAATVSSPTTAATAATTVQECQWGTWAACSAICRGQRLRLRTCSGVQQGETEVCNTQTGIFRNGWYLASNCLEYFVSPTQVNHYTVAESQCAALTGRLASTGMRVTSLRTEILLALRDNFGSTVEAWIGVTDIDIDQTWEWSDDVTQMPDFWDSGNPDNGNNRDCGQITLGSAFSLNDRRCNRNSRYICERTPQ